MIPPKRTLESVTNCKLIQSGLSPGNMIRVCSIRVRDQGFWAIYLGAVYIDVPRLARGSQSSGTDGIDDEPVVMETGLNEESIEQSMALCGSLHCTYISVCMIPKMKAFTFDIFEDYQKYSVITKLTLIQDVSVRTSFADVLYSNIWYNSIL